MQNVRVALCCVSTCADPCSQDCSQVQSRHRTVPSPESLSRWPVMVTLPAPRCPSPPPRTPGNCFLHYLPGVEQLLCCIFCLVRRPLSWQRKEAFLVCAHGLVQVLAPPAPSSGSVRQREPRSPLRVVPWVRRSPARQPPSVRFSGSSVFALRAAPKAFSCAEQGGWGARTRLHIPGSRIPVIAFLTFPSDCALTDSCIQHAPGARCLSCPPRPWSWLPRPPQQDAPFK